MYLEDDEGDFFEFKLTNEDLYEFLLKGKQTEARWRSREKVYVNVLDPEAIKIDRDTDEGYDSWGEAQKRVHKMIYNPETLEAEILIPYATLKNGFLEAINFSQRLGNLTVEPNDGKKHDMFIRIVMPKNSDKNKVGPRRFELRSPAPKAGILNQVILRTPDKKCNPLF